jgi:hypothetical protein
MGVTDIPAPKEKTGPFITVDHLVSGIVDDKCRFGVAGGSFADCLGAAAPGGSCH